MSTMTPEQQSAIEEAELQAEVSDLVDVANKRTETVNYGGELKDALGGEKGTMETVYPGVVKAARVTLYDAKTGQPTTVLPYMVEFTLRQRDPETGERIWTGRQPNADYKQGEVPCSFHPDSPRRPIVIEAGLEHVRCKKATLRTNLDREIHEKAFHPQETTSLKAHQDRADREAAQELQRLQIEEVKAQREARLGAAEKPVAATSELFACDSCDRRFPTEHGLLTHTRMSH